MKKTIRIATRKSALALWQANAIKSALMGHYPELTVELIGLVTEGDKNLDTPLYDMGGKALFVKELEIALLDNKADIAVHSIKDLPAEIPPGLMLATICQREDPRDVLVSAHYQQLEELPIGANVATSSLRRQAQLKALRPDLQMHNLRGNVDTRLKKAAENQFDAIILAAAGIKRLGQEAVIKQYFATDVLIPAIGQGAIGIECRSDDTHIQQLIAPLDHPETRYAIQSERAMNQQFGGNCKIPIAAFAQVNHDKIELNGMIGKPDGSKILYCHQAGNVKDTENIGKKAAEELMRQGAAEILKNL